MKYTYIPRGVCARKISFEVESGKLMNVEFEGGCNGNLKAISKLIEGKDAKEISEILSGNTCGMKGTSCGDQLSKAIVEALNSEK